MAATGLKPHHRRSHRGRPTLGLAALLLAALLIAHVPAPALVPDPAQAAKPKPRSGIPKPGLWAWQARDASGRITAHVEWLVLKSRHNPRNRIQVGVHIKTGGVNCDPALNPVKPESGFPLNLPGAERKIGSVGGKKKRFHFTAHNLDEGASFFVMFTSKTRAKGSYSLDPNGGWWDFTPPHELGGAYHPSEGDCVWQSPQINRRFFKARRLLSPAAFAGRGCEFPQEPEQIEEALQECYRKYPARKVYSQQDAQFNTTWYWGSGL